MQSFSHGTIVMMWTIGIAVMVNSNRNRNFFICYPRKRNAKSMNQMGSVAAMVLTSPEKNALKPFSFTTLIPSGFFEPAR